MRTPALEAALGGWDRDEFEFTFMCLSIAPALPLAEIEPARWYLMPGD
jgi:hypothetical protein